MIVQYKENDIARFRETVQTIYRWLGFLQRDQICCESVTVEQCYTLQILRREGELPPGELASRLGIDASSATRSIDVLERDGLVERQRPESGDRRRVIVRLTPKGEKLTDRLLAAGDAFFDRVLSAFPETERGQVVSTLERLAEVIGQTEGCCDPFRLTKSGND